MSAASGNRPDPLVGPPRKPLSLAGHRLWQTFIGKNAPKEADGSPWTYLMLHKDGRPFAWHTFGSYFRHDIARKYNRDTWFAVYVPNAHPHGPAAPVGTVQGDVGQEVDREVQG